MSLFIMNAKIFFIIMKIMYCSNAFSMEIRVLQWDGYIPELKQKEFSEKIKKEKNINITWSVETIVDENQLFSKARIGSADILFPGVDITRDERFQFLKQGLLHPIDLAKLPGVRKNIPIQNLLLPHIYFEGKQFGIPFNIGRLIAAYNSKKIQPKQFMDMFGSGVKFGSVNFAPHVPWIVAGSLGLSGHDLKKIDKVRHNDEFKSRLQTILTKAHVFFDNGVDNFEQAKDLDAFVGWGFSLGELNSKSDGAWKTFPLKGGSIAWNDSAVLSRKALEQHPEKEWVLYALLDFITTQEYQYEVVIKGTSSIPANPKAMSLIKPEERLNFAHLYEWLAEPRITYFPPLKRRDRGGFQSVFKKAKEGKLIRLSH